MSQHYRSSVTLYQWNILLLPDEREIFVGLANRPETVPPFAPLDAADELLPFILQNSSAIKAFDEKTGVGFDSDGSRYVLLGKPSDPMGMIRLSVGQMMKVDEIRWKYEFID